MKGLNMDAAEAKELADRAQARIKMRTYLETIEGAAKRGSYEQSFGTMDEAQISALKLLGFKVERIHPNTSVRWGAT